MHLYIFYFLRFPESFLLLYIISMLYIVAILSLVLVRETKRMAPYVIVAMPFNFILSSSHLFY